MLEQQPLEQHHPCLGLLLPQESVKKEEPTEAAAAMEVDAPSASPAAEAPSPAPPAVQDASAAAAQAQARASITAHAEMLQRKYGIPFESLARLSPIDWASAPAALLTRDLACALLAACEPGALLYPRGEQPTTASVVQAGPEVGGVAVVVDWTEGGIVDGSRCLLSCLVRSQCISATSA